MRLTLKSELKMTENGISVPKGALVGKHIWISGATQGLGLKICEALVENWCRGLIMTDILDEAKGKKIADGLAKSHSSVRPATKVWYHRVDVRSVNNIAESLWRGKIEMGGLDMVVNNAGVTGFADLKGALEVNTVGTIQVTEQALKAFSADRVYIKKARTILNISSASGIFPLPDGGEYYSASKHAVVGYSKSVAPIALEQGVRVVCLCPGWVDVGMGKMMANQRQDIIDRTGMSFLKVEQVTDVVLQILQSDGFSGKVIYMSGDKEACLAGVRLGKPLFPRAKL